MLGSSKQSFFSNLQVINLSQDFEDFRPWLTALRYDFAAGFKSQPINEDQPSWRGQPAAPIPFDDETLGGRVDYSTIIEPTRHLGGKLKGLVVRYNPALPPLPTSAGSVQADA